LQAYKEEVMARWSLDSRLEEPAFTEEQGQAPLPALTELPGWSALVSAAGGCCLRCRAGGAELVAAFITPLREGGRPTLANVQPLCRICAELARGSGVDYRGAVQVA
jgi:hypothetical protein